MDGPGKSIWRANGHPKVITVGAANIKKEWTGYSSSGPPGLKMNPTPKKPDICAPSHFTGYTNSDSGTSAACPVAAGVIGLILNAKPKLSQDVVKSALQKTATDVCAEGWDANSGYGIINAKKAVEIFIPENKKKTVEKYAVLHYRDGTTGINVYFDDGSWDYYIKLDSGRALLLLHIFRKEKPVYWTEGPDILWSGREPVGEDET